MYKSGIIHLVIASLLLAAVPGRGEEYSSPSDGILTMKYAGGRFSLETRDAPLERVLKEMSRLGDLIIIADGPVEGQITVHVEDLPADAAAKKVLRGKNLSFLYRSTEPVSSPEPYRLSEIRIYVSEGNFAKEHSFSYAKKHTSPSPVPALTPEPPPTPTESPAGLQGQDPLAKIGEGMDPEEVLAALLTGDQDAMDNLSVHLHLRDPEVQEQMREFVDALEQAKAEAEAAGEEVPSTESLGAMGAIMKNMMERRRDRE